MTHAKALGSLALLIFCNTPVESSNKKTEWIDCENLSYSPVSIEDCDKQLGKFQEPCMNQDNLSFRGFAANLAKCEKEASEKREIIRLRALEATNSKQFQTEKAAYVSFKQASEKFCLRFFDERCHANSCGICLSTCRQTMTKYWDRTQKAMEANNLDVGISGSRSELSAEPRLIEPVTKYFKDFSRLLCDQPNFVWKSKKIPANCENSIKRDIVATLGRPFKIEEGNICSWTEN
jgi:hypothetical protein